MLYERTALSRKPDELATARVGLPCGARDRSVPALLLKDPYILDFLELKDHYVERDFEDAILRELESFLLELGAGFSFVARQKRIQLDGEDFYIDLLFYNRKLKRLVVVELKQGVFRAEHKGQMELYLRWLAKYEREADEARAAGNNSLHGRESPADRAPGTRRSRHPRSRVPNRASFSAGA